MAYQIWSMWIVPLSSYLPPTTEEVNAILSVYLPTNWSTFEPDPDHSPDAGSGLLSVIAYALQRGILLRRENPTSKHRRVVLRRRNTVVGGKYALPSAVLVCRWKYRDLEIWLRDSLKVIRNVIMLKFGYTVYTFHSLSYI